MAWEPDADGHPGDPWHQSPSTAWPVCSGSAGPRSRSLGAAQPQVHPSHASVGRGEAVGKPPIDVLPPVREGALSQNFG